MAEVQAAKSLKAYLCPLMSDTAVYLRRVVSLLNVT